LSHLHLEFEYELPLDAVYEWWTDLSGIGYVGKSLKALKPIGKEGNAILVETKWRIMGMTRTLVEKLTLESQEHWTWQPAIFGIEITDDFRLVARNRKTVLTIDSEIKPKGVKGWLTHMMVGSMLERMMADEWKSASEALVSELRPRSYLTNELRLSELESKTELGPHNISSGLSRKSKR